MRRYREELREGSGKINVGEDTIGRSNNNYRRRKFNKNSNNGKITNKAIPGHRKSVGELFKEFLLFNLTTILVRRRINLEE